MTEYERINRNVGCLHAIAFVLWIAAMLSGIAILTPPLEQLIPIEAFARGLSIFLPWLLFGWLTLRATDAEDIQSGFRPFLFLAWFTMPTIATAIATLSSEFNPYILWAILWSGGGLFLSGICFCTKQPESWGE